MAHENRIITSAGTNIWFAAGGASPAVKWNGSSPATPWTSQSTTPFEISLNDTTGGKWTPQEAVPIDVYAGDTPLPRTPASYPRVTETIPIQILGTTHDAIVAALRLLKHELRAISMGAPALLVFDPDGATNAGYTEIYSASAQPNALFINDENGQGMMRVALTIERAPFFTNLASGISALSSGNHTNQAGSNTRNLPSTLNGDLSNEGLPLNIRLTGTAIPGNRIIRKVYMASIAQSVATPNGSTSIATPSTSTPKFTYTFDTTSYASLFSALAGNARLRLRVILRLSSITVISPTPTTLQVYVSDAGWSQRVSILPEDRVVDMGDFVPDAQRRGAGELDIDLYLISGGPVTLVNIELLAYYDFVSGPFWQREEWQTNDGYAELTEYLARSNRATLPLTSAIGTRSSTVYSEYGQSALYGTPPRAYPGAKLWLAWTTIDGGTSAPNTAFTEQMTTIATYAPLFLSFRGAQ